LTGLPAGLCHELMTMPVGVSAARAAGARTSAATAAQTAMPIDPNSLIEDPTAWNTPASRSVRWSDQDLVPIAFGRA
jgi:hypothetical protein